MTLLERPAFDALLTPWPGVTFVDQWDAHVAKVGGKVFAVLGETDAWRLVIKVSEESFEILTSMEGVSQAPYFAKRKWVNINDRAPLERDDLEYYLRRSYELVAQGLTKKLRTELRIEIS